MNAMISRSNVAPSSNNLTNWRPRGSTRRLSIRKDLTTFEELVDYLITRRTKPRQASTRANPPFEPRSVFSCP